MRSSKPESRSSHDPAPSLSSDCRCEETDQANLQNDVLNFYGPSFSGDPENPFLGSLKRVNEYEDNGNKTAAVALRVVLLLEVQYLETQNPLLEMRAEVGEDVVVVARV